MEQLQKQLNEAAGRTLDFSDMGDGWYQVYGGYSDPSEIEKKIKRLVAKTSLSKSEIMVSEYPGAKAWPHTYFSLYILPK